MQQLKKIENKSEKAINSPNNQTNERRQKTKKNEIQ